MKKIHIIGAGFSGLSAACHLSKEGFDVTVIEKNKQIGGRARSFESDGFKFDMGPSWYWMPEIFEGFYNTYGYSAADFYSLKRLDPSYQIFYGDGDVLKIPANKDELFDLFERYEPGARKKLVKYLRKAKRKYETGMRDFVYKPSLHPWEYLDYRIFKNSFDLNLFSSISKEIRSSFKNSKLIQLLEFPVIFLGAQPKDIPALYSLMNYADVELGTWYPHGGMYGIIQAMHKIATELGSKFKTGVAVNKLICARTKVTELISEEVTYKTDCVLSTADYEFTEQKLLDLEWRQYSSEYWSKRILSPSCLLFYIGIGKEVPGLLHHNLFFDGDYSRHLKEIYKTKLWPQDPLFYVCCPSKSDDTVAPEGMENIFILMPLAPGIEDTEEKRKEYFELIVGRIKKKTGVSLDENIKYFRSYCIKDFIKDYNAHKGNAYGLANTLFQTAFLKPKMKSRKLSNLFFAGQFTVPGPGVPPSIISGEIAARQITKLFGS